MTTLNIEPPAAMPDWPSLVATWEMARDDLEQEYDTDEELDFYCDARTEALDAVLHAPAPDLAAVAVKLETYIKEDCAGLRWEDEGKYSYMKSILDDVRRLSGETPDGQ